MPKVQKGFKMQFAMGLIRLNMAGTKVGAETLGFEKEIGTLEKGKKADLLVVNKNPLGDIACLQNKENLLIAMKDGQIVVDRR
ncbi:MAG: amidohydrolase family protein [Candidatus Heimdallarchaeota archaeon]|nr:MAG: amidohydrolase family protein [Candidatus Heimdallarchaeota archaeon]